MGMNMFNAAIAAGYSPNTAKNAGVKFKKIEKGGISDALERAGLTDAVMTSELARIALGSTKLHSCDIYIQKQADGTYKINENSNDLIELSDDQVRIKAIELASKLKGLLKDKVEHSGNITFTKMGEIQRDGNPVRFKIGEN